MEKYYKKAMDFKIYFKLYIAYFLTLLVAIIALIISIVIHPLEKGSFYYIAPIIFGGLALVHILSMMFVLISTWFVQKAKFIKLTDKNIFIPKSGFGFQFYNEELDGYIWIERCDFLTVYSKLTNISKVWRVADPTEIKEITKKRGMNLTTRIPYGPARIRARELGPIKQGLREGTFKNSFAPVIKEQFKTNHVYDPHKAIGITFKKVNAYPLAESDPLSKNIDKMHKGVIRHLDKHNPNSYIRPILDHSPENYPKFTNITLYVSVAKPDELVRDIKRMIKHG